MSSYITGFSVYTLAMIGVIFIALVVAKKALSFTPHGNKNDFLKIEKCLNLEPRKNLYVIKAGRERFLLATSGEGCQFMTKLATNASEAYSNSFLKNSSNEPEINPEKFHEIEIPEIKSLKTDSKKYTTGIF